jgi:chromosome segregation ATPase
MAKGPLWDWIGLDDLALQLSKIDAKLNILIAGQQAGKELLMAERDEIQNLVQQVTANRNAVDSAKQALQGYMSQISDLTQKLQDAIANDSDVSPDIKQAADDLKANTDALVAAIPQVAQAVDANT